MQDSSTNILNRIVAECKITGEPFLILTFLDSSGQVSRKLFTASEITGIEAELKQLDFPIDKQLILQRILHGRENSAILPYLQGEERRTLIIEVIKPRPSILIFGAGHVGRAVAQIGITIGYDVTIVDDRIEYLSSETLSLTGLTRIHSSFDSATERLEISPLTAIVIVTRGHQHDEICLKSVLKSKACYIGLIGSKRRIRGVFQRLYDQGYSNLETDRIFAPIGLAIHAKTPQEIAIAILAQIIQVMNNEGANNHSEER